MEFPVTLQDTNEGELVNCTHSWRKLHTQNTLSKTAHSCKLHTHNTLRKLHTPNLMDVTPRSYISSAEWSSWRIHVRFGADQACVREIGKVCGVRIEKLHWRLFKISSPLWASRTASLKRTTNALLSHPDPDIFSFAEKVIKFQTKTYVGIQSLSVPKQIRPSYGYSKKHRNSHRTLYK